MYHQQSAVTAFTIVGLSVKSKAVNGAQIEDRYTPHPFDGASEAPLRDSFLNTAVLALDAWQSSTDEDEYDTHLPTAMASEQVRHSFFRRQAACECAAMIG